MPNTQRGRTDQISLPAKIMRSVGLFFVVMLIIIFIAQFGGNQAEGCNALWETTYAATVYGETISQGEFRATFDAAQFNERPVDVQKQYHLRENTLQGLVERNLLARAARDMGLEVSGQDVWDHVAQKGTMYISMSVDSPDGLGSGELPMRVKDENGKFDSESVQRYIQYGLRMSVSEYEHAQRLEMLAARMRGVVESTVRVSPREVWDAWVREHESVKLKYVRFSPASYRDSLNPTQQEIETWMTANAAAVDQEYNRQKYRYTGLEKQVRSRYILVRVDSDASAEAKATARAKAEDILKRARKGEDFAALARATSEDRATGRRGGDLGYNPRGRHPEAFDNAQFSLQPGQISDIVDTDSGFNIIKVEGKREGDVPLAEAKLEIAERLYREHQASDMAKHAAEQALAQLKAGTTMDALNEQLTGKPAGADSSDDTGAEPSDEEDSLSPHVEETTDFGRSDTPISGDDGAITRAAYKLTEEAPLPDAAMQVGQDWVVFRLEGRVVAKEADFTDEDRTRLTQALNRQKTIEAVAVYVRQLRREAEEAEQIRINNAMLDYEPKASANEE